MKNIFIQLLIVFAVLFANLSAQSYTTDGSRYLCGEYSDIYVTYPTSTSKIYVTVKGHLNFWLDQDDIPYEDWYYLDEVGDYLGGMDVSGSFSRTYAIAGNSFSMYIETSYAGSDITVTWFSEKNPTTSNSGISWPASASTGNKIPLLYRDLDGINIGNKFNDTFTSYLSVKDNGRVGIGTPTPGAMLELNGGNIQLNGGTLKVITPNIPAWARGLEFTPSTGVSGGIGMYGTNSTVQNLYMATGSTPCRITSYNVCYTKLLRLGSPSAIRRFLNTTFI